MWQVFFLYIFTFFCEIISSFDSSVGDFEWVTKYRRKCFCSLPKRRRKKFVFPKSTPNTHENWKDTCTRIVICPTDVQKEQLAWKRSYLINALDNAAISF